MNLDDFAKNLRAFVVELEQQLPFIMSRLALDAKDMIEQRVTTTGRNADEAEFGEYVEGPYKEYREERGLETAFVDFRNTGAMWNNITIIEQRVSAALATVTIGSSTQEEEDKLGWQEERYGNEVLELTLNEIAELEEQFVLEVQLLLNKFIT